jgi:hypothetical protein
MPGADQREDITGMPEVNPTAVITDCIEKSKATVDQELIAITSPKHLASCRSASGPNPPRPSWPSSIVFL